MKGDIHFHSARTQEQITFQWDRIASARDEQLRNDDDVSFSRILKPLALDSLQDARSVVDVGCGTGRLTSVMKGPNRRVVGIDPSSESIKIARCHDPAGVYIVDTLEAWTKSHPHDTFELAIVNMVLMDVPDLSGFMHALARVARGGRIVATITHPAFWPLYWDYASKGGFDYGTETIVEAPFRTSTMSYPLSTTHTHRPLSSYLDHFRRSGMTLHKFEEIRGIETTAVFPFPRFAVFEATV